MTLYDGANLVWGSAPGPSTPDTTAPSVPGTPVASAITSTSATPSWTASTDTGGSGLAGTSLPRSPQRLAGATRPLRRPGR